MGASRLSPQKPQPLPIRTGFMCPPPAGMIAGRRRAAHWHSGLRKPLPPTPSPQRRGGASQRTSSLLPLSLQGRGLGGGVFLRAISAICAGKDLQRAGIEEMMPVGDESGVDFGAVAMADRRSPPCYSPAEAPPPGVAMARTPLNAFLQGEDTCQRFATFSRTRVRKWLLSAQRRLSTRRPCA